MTDQSLKKIIRDCKKHKRKAQKELYQSFYSYAISIAMRYGSNREEAEEIINDSFLKVFSKIQSHYNDQLSFKGWLRRIVIHTSIDYYRRNEKMKLLVELPDEKITFDETILDKISADEIMQLVQQLTPGYRMVFNLYSIEGYKHHEIADMLEISEGTSKSNLFKARLKLQKMIKSIYGEIKIQDYGG